MSLTYTVSRCDKFRDLSLWWSQQIFQRWDLQFMPKVEHQYYSCIDLRQSYHRCVQILLFLTENIQVITYSKKIQKLRLHEKVEIPYSVENIICHFGYKMIPDTASSSFKRKFKVIYVFLLIQSVYNLCQKLQTFYQYCISLKNLQIKL